MNHACFENQDKVIFQLNNVMLTDECTVMMENQSKITFHSKWEQQRVKGRPKHPVKVHIWARICKQGPTRLMIFKASGMLNSM